MHTISRRSFLAGLVASAALVGTACSSDASTTSTADGDAAAPAADDAAAETPAAEISGIHHAVIEVEGYGTIEVALNADVAPITVANFMELAQSGFYDGLTFHRIIDGFMIQGGDPEGNGFGGSSRTIEGEFAANGHENNLTHVRGVISMARSSDYNSASSQFFIMQKTTHSLDGSYAAFGTVTSGIEVVDEICANTPVEDANGTVLPENQPVITSITIVD